MVLDLNHFGLVFCKRLGEWSREDSGGAFLLPPESDAVCLPAGWAH